MHADLGRDERELVGRWVKKQDRVVTDDLTARIDQLVSERPERTGTAERGWATIFRDPRDDRLWELTYPRSEWHGAGPPRLRLVPAPDCFEAED